MGAAAWRQIENLDFGAGNAPGSGYQPANGSNQYNGYSQYGEPAPNRPYDSNTAYRTGNRLENDWAVLPAGTRISVRTGEDIRSQSATGERRYPAAIAQDVVDASGDVVIPRGSEAQLGIRRMTEGGTFTSGDFILDLDSVRVNGRPYAVSSESIQRGNQGIGANRPAGSGSPPC